MRGEPPRVGTGKELEVAANSGMVGRARNDGTVTWVDAKKIVLDGTDEYVLRKFQGLNERTCMNQTPLVELGQKVHAKEIIADGPATLGGELALGKNLLVAFMTFDGNNFEDAIILSERMVRDDTLTSIHIDEYDVECPDAKLRRDEFTSDNLKYSVRRPPSRAETAT